MDNLSWSCPTLGSAPRLSAAAVQTDEQRKIQTSLPSGAFAYRLLLMQPSLYFLNHSRGQEWQAIHRASWKSQIPLCFISEEGKRSSTAVDVTRLCAAETMENVVGMGNKNLCSAGHSRPVPRTWASACKGVLLNSGRQILTGKLWLHILNIRLHCKWSHEQKLCFYFRSNE